MSRRFCLGALILSTLCLRAHSATAADTGSRPIDPSKVPSNHPATVPLAHALELQAGAVTMDGRLNKLRLSDSVELRVSRYHLSAEQLTLERTPGGIVVEGEGQVAFCPCSNPPVTVGFSSARVAPPTDLLLSDSTCRAGGVPFFWMPALWLRSPDRLGLLSPHFAVRATDGPWMGTGLHVPLAGQHSEAPQVLDVLVGGYAKGGVDLGAQWASTRSTATVRWDWRGRGLFWADARGSESLGGDFSAAGRVDLLKGPRALTGPVDYQTVTRRYDRTRIEVVGADGTAMAAFGLHTDGPRGDRYARFGDVGPSVRVGIGTAISDVGHVESNTLAWPSRSEEGDQQALALHATDLQFDARPGPLAFRSVSRERWLLGTGSYRSAGVGLLGTQMSLSLPLISHLGNHAGHFTHWLEPGLSGSVALRGSAARQDGERLHPFTSARLSVDNVLGDPDSAESARWQLIGGSISDRDRLHTAFVSRWTGSFSILGLGGDLGWVDQSGWFSSSRARVGRIDSLALTVRVDGREHEGTALARWLTDEAWSPWMGGWLDRDGWTGHLQADVALSTSMATAAMLDYDATADTWLSERAAVGYRHSCGCLALWGSGGRRRGREGWDVTVTLDLMP